MKEKYGVEFEDEKTKTASKEMKCPKCGAAIRVPNYCDVCGTEPFEKREKNQKK